MRVAVLYTPAADEAPPEERDGLAQRDAVVAALESLGHRAEAVAFGGDLSAAREDLRRARPERVFNLVESVAGEDRLVHFAPALLEALSLAFTGSSSEAMLRTTDKLAAKRLLRAAGLPTPEWWDLDAFERRGPAPGARVVVKSAWDHGSVGLDESSILDVDRASSVAARVRDIRRGAGASAFAERYVEGREFNLSLLAGPAGVEVLPPAEIRFVDYPPGKARVVGYRAKWVPGSFEYAHTPRSFDFPAADAALLGRLSELARATWELFGLAGYARVDFRVDAAGQPWILEVNANPCLTPDAGFAAAAGRAGLAYAETIGRILEDAVGTATRGRPAGPAGAGGELTLRREVAETDREAVRAIVESGGAFHEHETRVAVELVDERLARGPASGYHFVFAEAGGAVLGYACWGPIACTAGSFDLYWIAVMENVRGRGTGRRLIAAAEGAAAAAGGRRMYAETSSRPDYALTRAFYESCGYRLEATLEDFYAPGDARMTYVKVLQDR